MDRGPANIQTEEPLDGFIPARLSGRALLRHGLDPLLAVLVYLALLAMWRLPVTASDLAVLVLTFFLAFPAGIPFREFSAHTVGRILQLWAKVALGIGLLWGASQAFAIDFRLHRGLAAAWLFAAPLAMLFAHWVLPQLLPRLSALSPRSKLAFVGLNGVAVRMAQAISELERDRRVVLGYFDDRSPARLAAYGDQRIIGRLDDVSEYVKANGVDAIYISLPLASQPRVVALLQALGDTTASIHFLPDIYVANPIQGRVTTLSGLPVVSVRESPFDGAAGALKRTLDLALVLASLPVLVPLAAAIVLLVRTTSPGPALFRQRRYGLDGREIMVLKFRTMTTLEDGHGTYAQVTRDDDRVTPVGRFLRRTSLDELPQLWNVLCGSMSLVGPRPHALAVNEQYRRLIPGYMVRHKVKPGITGLAQVNGCRGGNDLESMRRRTEYDLAYLRSWSLTLDLWIIWQTVKLLARGDEHAY